MWYLFLKLHIYGQVKAFLNFQAQFQKLIKIEANAAWSMHAQRALNQKEKTSRVLLWLWI